jgi:DNA-directed RNA polymerase specialized sigma24 family protein
MPHDAISPSRSRPAGARSDDIEVCLRAAYVHVHRYFRHWLRGVPDGDRLAHDLAGETLVRIARSSDSPGEPEPLLISAWLAIAHEVARELANGAR